MICHRVTLFQFGATIFACAAIASTLLFVFSCFNNVDCVLQDWEVVVYGGKFSIMRDLTDRSLVNGRHLEIYSSVPLLDAPVIWPPVFGWAIPQEIRVEIALWWPATLLSIATLLLAKRDIVQMRRSRMGNCVHCGYVIHNITSERCPECGTNKSEVVTTLLPWKTVGCRATFLTALVCLIFTVIAWLISYREIIGVGPSERCFLVRGYVGAECYADSAYSWTGEFGFVEEESPREWFWWGEERCLGLKLPLWFPILGCVVVIGINRIVRRLALMDHSIESSGPQH